MRGDLGGDPRALAEVVEVLGLAVQELDELCYRWALATFGVWGAHWFAIAATGQFSLDLEQWPEVEVPTAKLLDLVRKPSEGETEQEWAVATQARNQWIYEQVMAGVKYTRIISDLKAMPAKWQRISSIPGIKAVARRYAKQHSLPLPKPRQPGRPAGR
jgi:hypothetical protein